MGLLVGLYSLDPYQVVSVSMRTDANVGLHCPDLWVFSERCADLESIAVA